MKRGGVRAASAKLKTVCLLYDSECVCVCATLHHSTRELTLYVHHTHSC